MAVLFGTVYGALSIDIIKFCKYELEGPNGEWTVETILRCLDCDQSFLLQTLPTISSYGGYHLEVVTKACTPALFTLV